MGTRNYQEKILSSFRDIPEKDDFFDIFFKNNKNVRRFLSGKFSDFSNSEYSRICLENSSVGTKNNQVKILSSFRVSEKDVFSTFFQKKKNVTRFLDGKFSDFSNLEYSKICL